MATNDISDHRRVINKLPGTGLLDCCKFFKDGQVPFVMFRAGKCFMEGGGIRKVEVGLASGIHEVGIIQYKTCDGRHYSVFKEHTINEILICIHNHLLVMAMSSKVVRVISGGSMSGACGMVSSGKWCMGCIGGGRCVRSGVICGW